MAEHDPHTSDIDTSEAMIEEAMERCAQELKALAFFYQAHNRPQWAKETYSAFLQIIGSEDSDSGRGETANEGSDK